MTSIAAHNLVSQRYVQQWGVVQRRKERFADVGRSKEPIAPIMNSIRICDLK